MPNLNQKLTHVIKGRTVEAVQQNSSGIQITFTDGSTMHVATAGPTDSVMVRDAKNEMEYAD